jgi:hypothetical protein
MVDYLLAAIDTAKKILNKEEVSFEYYDPDNMSSATTKQVLS